MTNPAPIARFIHGTNVDESVFERNVRSALDYQDEYPFFEDKDRSIMIVAGGPSLNGTCAEKVGAEIEEPSELWALNGAWQIVHNARVVGTVVIMDARADNLKFIDPSAQVNEWLVASQCNPLVFGALYSGCCDVTIWHAAGPKIIDTLGLKGIRGGGTVLSRAINLAWERGFRDFTLAGVDSSITAEAHHAYSQAINDNDKRIEVETPKGARFITTPELAEQATTVFRQMREYEKIGGSFRIIADGLLPTLWAEFKADFPNGELTNV